MANLISMRGEISPPVYAIVAPLLLLSQHALVAIVYRLHGQDLVLDPEFWLLPLRRLATLPYLAPLEAALVFTLSLAATWALAILSFRRAAWANRGYGLATLSIVPALQIAIVVFLAGLRGRSAEDEAPAVDPATASQLRHNVQGLLAGVAIIVFAVLVSAITFGAYGSGLFVLTPVTVGMTTAYISNRDADLGFGPTVGVVMRALALGGLALVALALEGVICIVLAAPLAAGAALLGVAIGYPLARAGHRRGKPLFAVAILPAIFALDAAIPPSVSIATYESIDIAAPPTAVWQALVSEDPVAIPAGLVGRAGLAFPVRSRLLGDGLGATRLGEFSTGTARERITEWEPGRMLAFEVLSQPPAMEEMSPYRRVHAPHVEGYFTTNETRFSLARLPGGGTRLTVRATHDLRIDPVLYWEPIARWAVRENTRRVLRDIGAKAIQDRASRAARIASRSVS